MTSKSSQVIIFVILAKEREKEWTGKCSIISSQITSHYRRSGVEIFDRWLFLPLSLSLQNKSLHVGEKHSVSISKNSWTYCKEGLYRWKAERGTILYQRE